jgi:hypothetical protein
MTDIQPRKDIRAAARMTSFGVGCFHFGIRFVEPHKLTFADYLRDLRAVLASIDTITEVQIDERRIDLKEEFEVYDQPPDMSNGDCFPQFAHLRYSFLIYIPFRIQAELLGIGEKFVDSGSEQFRVYVRYSFNGPVTFVEPQDHADNARPSTGVVVVRKYIERRLDGSSKPLIFDSIGPSPFHADFYLKEVPPTEDKVPFHVSYVHSRAYDSIRIEAGVAGVMPSFADVLVGLFETIEDELSFFYDMKRDRASHIDRWTTLESSVRRAVAANSARHGLDRLRWLILRRVKLRNLIHSILGFRADIAFFKGSLRESYRQLYDAGKLQHFVKNYVDAGIAGLYEYPLAESLEMVKFEYDRATKFFEWTTIVAAAAIGGVVGAVVTRMVGA